MKEKVLLKAQNLRDFADGDYKSVDDTPFGGNQGMLFKPEVLDRALKAELLAAGQRQNLKVLYPSPKGLKMAQPVLEALATWLVSEQSNRICIIAGRYEGIDERIISQWVDIEYSLGDFILSGGEIPALALLDGVVRLIPGVLGDDRSHREESFSNGLLEHPQYTKPRHFEGLDVPAELTGGNHQKAEEWKLQQSIMLTYAFRPDLIRKHQGEGLPSWARELLENLQRRIDLRT